MLSLLSFSSSYCKSSELIWNQKYLFTSCKFPKSISSVRLNRLRSASKWTDAELQFSSRSRQNMVSLLLQMQPKSTNMKRAQQQMDASRSLKPIRRHSRSAGWKLNTNVELYVWNNNFYHVLNSTRMNFEISRYDHFFKGIGWNKFQSMKLSTIWIIHKKNNDNLNLRLSSSKIHQLWNFNSF